MSSDLSNFYSSVTAIKTELGLLSNCGQSKRVLDPVIFQTFLYYSIDYVGGHTATTVESDQPVQLQEWFSLLSDVIRLLFQHRGEWEQILFPRNLISFLYNISFELLQVAQVPLYWQKLLWFSLLETMLLYSNHPSTGPELISAIAQQGYLILLAAIKKAKELQPDNHTNVSSYYEIYLLGVAVTNLDNTGKSENQLKLAKELLNNYFSSCTYKINNATNEVSPAGKCGLQHSILKVVEMAVIVYTLQPREVAADASLLFYTELFRVSLEHDVLREKLLACGGNLFKFAFGEVADGFSAAGFSTDGVCAAFERNSTASTVNKNMPNTVQSIVQPILTFIHEMKQVAQEPQVISNQNKKTFRPVKSTKKNETAGSSTKEQPLTSINSAIDSIQALLKESPGPTSLIISDSLEVLVYSVPRSQNISSEILFTSIRLISLAVDTFVRHIFQCASEDNQVYMINKRLHAVATAATVIIFILDNLLLRDQLDMAKVRELADMLKSTLQALHCLVEASINRKVTCHQLLYKSVFPVLRKAMSDIGIVGRKLTQQGLHSIAITFLSPLWPVTRMVELLPSISHHETLCESYLKTSQLKEVWSVISEAVTTDASLVSEPVIRVLVKVLKQEPSLSVLKLFESCQDKDKGMQLLVLVAYKLSLTQSMPAVRQALNVPRFLVNYKGMSDADLAVQRFFLAQALWFEAEDKTSVSGECLDLLKKATDVLLTDSSQQFDDILAQAAFLYWSMLNILSHLAIGGEIAEEVDSEFLMIKATSCLKVWTAWFTSVGQKLIEEDGLLRLDASLRFLQKIADLAIINYKTTVAVAALCRAHHLASLMKHSEVMSDVMQTLIVLIPQLGLQCASAKDSPEDHSFLLDIPKFEQSGNLSSLTAIAAHHLKTGQLEKFVLARDLAAKMIEDSMRKGLHTCSIYTALAIINRLDAEFHSSPASIRVPGTGNCHGPMTHPLELAAESLKNINTVVTLHLGEDFQSTGSKKPSLEFWRVIHEYLLSIKQCGNLCLHTGNSKCAKTYFTDGLTIAKKCLLVTWSAIFSVCLLKLSLLYHDTTLEADTCLQSAVNLLKKYKLAVDKTEVNGISSRTPESVLASQNVSRIFDRNAAGMGATVADSRCPCNCEDNSTLRSQLLANMTEVLGTAEEITMEGLKVLTYVVTCDRCFQPEIAQLCADLMTSQAEIVWRNKGAVSSVTSTLQSAVDCSEPLMSRSHQKNAQKSLLLDYNLDIELQPLEINTNCLPTIDAVYKLTEVKWQDLFRHDGERIDDNEGVREIENLLDVVEKEGKKMKGRDNSNVLVASALLMRSHLVYQLLLQAKVEDVEKDVVSEAVAIKRAVMVAKKEKQQWDEKQIMWLHLSNAPGATANLSLPVKANMSKMSAQATNVSNCWLDGEVLNSAPDLNGGKIKIVSNENGEKRNIMCSQVGDKAKLICNNNGSKTEKASFLSGNATKICLHDSDKVKVLSNKIGNKTEVLSNQNGNKTEVVSNRSARKKYKSSYSIYAGACFKKARVVLGENSQKQDIYSIDNIGVESPRLVYSAVKGRNSTNKSADEQEKSLKSRRISQSQQSGIESEGKTGLSKASRSLRLSNQANKKSEQNVATKRDRNENDSKAPLKTVSRDEIEFCYEIEDEDTMESTSAVLVKKGKHLRKKKTVQDGNQSMGKVCNDRLKTNQEKCESKCDLSEDQDVCLTVKTTDGEADGEKYWKNLVEKSKEKENSRIKSNRKGGKSELKSRKKIDKQDDVMTPVKSRRKIVKRDDEMTLVKNTKTKRTRRVVCPGGDSPEAMTDFVENISTIKESRFHTEIDASCFRKGWDNDHDDRNYGMLEDDVTGVCLHENYTDVLLLHSLLPSPVKIEISDSAYFQENGVVFTAENGHLNCSLPIEIFRGRPQKRKAEREVPKSGRSVRGKGRERAIKKSCTSVNYPQLEVDIEEKENVLLETDDFETLPVIRKVKYDKEPKFLDRKAGNVLHFSTPSLSSFCKSKKGYILEESLSLNIANQPDIFKPTRQNVVKKDTGKQTVKARKIIDLIFADSCSGEDTVARTSGEEILAVRGSVVEAGGEVELQELVMKFPSLAYCQSVTTRIKYLQEALAQLDTFPHSVLYRQISRTLAMCLWEQDMTQVRLKRSPSGQREIAAYLTESMHITFQHLLAKNLHYKLRKSQNKSASDNSDGNWSQLSSEEAADVEREAMQTSLNTLTFGGDVMKRFTDRLKPLPAELQSSKKDYHLSTPDMSIGARISSAVTLAASSDLFSRDWTIGQITIADFDPTNPVQGQVFVTRLTSHLEPLTVGIPFERCQFLERALMVYEEAVVYKFENLTQEQHWMHRRQQDYNMKNLIFYLQELFLGGHKWLLQGQLTWVNDPAIQKLLDQATQDTVALVHRLHECHICCSSVRNLLEVLLQANEKEIASLVECVWPAHVARTVSQACMDVQRSVLAVRRVSLDATRGPLVLILDNKLTKLPWESMPNLFSDTLTRIPSLAALTVMVTVHKKQMCSPFQQGVDRSNVVAVIPPDASLQNAASCLAPQFKQYKGWKCLIQKVPTLSEFKSFLTDNSLYIYIGHNWGQQYVRGRDIQLIHGKAVAILMGCSSAKLDCKRTLDGDGGPLYFILAGCPAVMGNLWSVSDEDINKLTSQLFSQWMSQNKPTALGQLLVLARKACQLHGLTGFAPVVYGLPIVLT